MHEFTQFLQAREVFERARHAHIGLATNPIFHGFNIVIGHFLYRFNGGSIGFAEIGHHLRQMGALLGIQRRKFGQAGIAQRLKPGQFHLHAAVHKAVFAHQWTQRVQFGAVAAI